MSDTDLPGLALPITFRRICLPGRCLCSHVQHSRSLHSRPTPPTCFFFLLIAAAATAPDSLTGALNSVVLVVMGGGKAVARERHSARMGHDNLAMRLDYDDGLQLLFDASWPKSQTPPPHSTMAPQSHALGEEAPHGSNTHVNQPLRT